MNEQEMNDDETSALAEQPGCLGDEGGEDSHLEAHYEDRNHVDDEPSHGWPGDGSGEDDFQDFNQNEAADYQNE